MAQPPAEQRRRRRRHNSIVGKMEVVLNYDLGTCVFVTLQNLKDKYAQESGGEDVQAELEAIGFDVFNVVENCFPAFTAIRDPKLPGFLRRNVIDRPAQSSAMLTFDDGDHRVQGSSNRAAIEAPVEVVADGSDADVDPVKVMADGSDADVERGIEADLTVTETTECDVGRPPTEDLASPQSTEHVYPTAEVQLVVSEHTAARRESLRKRLSSPEIVAPPLAKPVIIELGFPGITSLPKAIPMPSPPSASVAAASVEVRSEEEQEDRTEVATVSSTTAQEVRSETAQEHRSERAQEVHSEPAQKVRSETLQEHRSERAQEVHSEPAQEVHSEPAQEHRSDRAQGDGSEVAQALSFEATQEERSEPAQDDGSEVVQALSFEATQEERSEPAQDDRSEQAQQILSDVAQDGSSEMAQEDSFDTTQEGGSEWVQDGRSESMQDCSMSERSSEQVVEETSDTEAYMGALTGRSATGDRYPSPVGVPSGSNTPSVASTTLGEDSGNDDALPAAQSVAMPPGFDVPSTLPIPSVQPDMSHAEHGSHLEPPPGFNSSSGRASSASTAHEEYPPWSTSTMKPLPASTPDDEEQTMPAWSTGDRYFEEEQPPADESICLTEEREEQWGIDSMDRIPTVGDFGMPAVIGRPPSVRRVLPISRPPPDNRQSQFATDHRQAQFDTRPSPQRDAHDDRTATPPNPSNAAALRPAARHDPYFLSDSEEGSTAPTYEEETEPTHEEERHAGSEAFNVHDYFDEDISASIPDQQQMAAESPSDAQESRDLLLDWDQAAVARTPVQTESVLVEEASTVPAQEPPQLTAKKATEEKLKALYTEGRQRTFGRAVDEPDFDCDAMNRSRPRQAPRSSTDAFFGKTPHADAFFGTTPEEDAFFGTTPQAPAETAAAPPLTAEQETSCFETPSPHATPLAESFNGTADTAPLPPGFGGGSAIPLPAPPARSDQPAPVDLSKPIPMPAPQTHEVKAGAPLAAERSESGTNPPRAGVESSRTALSQRAAHSRESSSATSVFEEESSSSGFRTPQEEFTPSSEGDPFARSAAPQDRFDTAEEGSEEEDETRTARPSGSSLAADMPATPKAISSMTALDQTTGDFGLSLEQFGLHELLPELVASVHPASQSIPASAASVGSTVATGALPAAIARGFEDFFDSQERSMPAPSSAHTAASLIGEVDLECFAPDFLEDLPSDVLSTEALDAQPSPAPSASAPPQPECEPYVMRDEWHIDNYEAASEERRRLCEESSDFREPPPEPVRAWSEQVKELPVLLDTLLDLDNQFPDGFTADEFAHYEYTFASTERYGIYHWAATTNVIGLHRMLELGMFTVDAANRRFRVNEAVLGVQLMALPYNFCSNLYRCLDDHGEMEVRHAMKSLKLFELPPTRLCDRDLLHLINHFPRVFLLESKDKDHDFFKATIRLNPDLPKWRVVLDVDIPHETLFMPIAGCAHPQCNGVPSAS